MVSFGYTLPSSLHALQCLPDTQRRSVHSPAGWREALRGQQAVSAPLPAAPTTGENKGAPKKTHTRAGRTTPLRANEHINSAVQGGGFEYVIFCCLLFPFERGNAALQRRVSCSSPAVLSEAPCSC